MALVQFLRGLDAKYSKTKYKDGVYFATDTGRLYLNGVQYGGDSDLKVSDVTTVGSKLKIYYTDGTNKTFDLVDLIPKATETSDGLMSTEDKIVIDNLTASLNSGMSLLSSEQAKIIADVKKGKYDNVVAGINTNDKILSIDDKVISATVSLSYDEDKKKIILRGKNNVNLGSVDATPFIKDGMLDDVNIVEATSSNPIGGKTSGKFIVFTWKVQDGYTKTDYIPASELIELYKPGNGVTIENKTIGIKVKIGDPYLEVTADGVASKGIDSAINIATTAIIGSETDSSDSITLYGIKKYTADLVNTHTTNVTNALSAKVNVSEYNEFVQNTNERLESIKVTDVDTSESIGISLTKSGIGVIGVSVAKDTLVESLIGTENAVGPISGVSVKLGEDITIDEKVEGSDDVQTVVIGKAGSSIQSVIKTLAQKVESTVAGGIVSIKGDNYISVTGGSISKNLSINIASIGSALVDNTSALKINNEGKLSIKWETLN